MSRWEIIWHRLRYWLITSSRCRYSIRYRGVVSLPEWTFSEAMKMSRSIPPKTGFVEILLPGGAVHFTCPPQPLPEDTQKWAENLQKTKR